MVSESLFFSLSRIYTIATAIDVIYGTVPDDYGLYWNLASLVEIA